MKLSAIRAYPYRLVSIPTRALPAAPRPDAFEAAPARRGARRPTRGLQPARAQEGATASGQPGSNPFGDNFAGRLFAATGREHGALSKHPLMARLRSGNSAAPYAQLLHDKLAVFAALEAVLPECADDPLVAALLQVPHLRRAARLQADIAALGRSCEASPAALLYAAHLRGMAFHQPSTLALHAWLHYLAEMFGGQGLQRALVGRLGPAAVTSFGFDAPLADLMPQTLHCLDALVQPEAEAALREEARAAYGWSRRLFDAAAAA